MAGLRALLGLSVHKVEEVHDYLQILFSDDTVLNIYNNYTYDAGPVLGIKGKTVKSVRDDEDRALIVFSDESSFSVGLQDSDYNGPEAMGLYQPGQPIVIWN